MSKVVIVDHGSGNLHSVRRGLDRMGVCAIVSSSPQDISSSEKIILPGVGHFGRAMDSLKLLGLVDALNEAVLIKRKPILGICLGMELMARASEEGDSEGFGWFDADIVRFRVADTLRYKVPHIGWNAATIKKESRLMNGIADRAEFYFVNSYHMRLADNADLLSESDYEAPFVSAVEKDNIFGVQYHPEKSHDVGLRVLRNFADL